MTGKFGAQSWEDARHKCAHSPHINQHRWSSDGPYCALALYLLPLSITGYFHVSYPFYRVTTLSYSSCEVLTDAKHGDHTHFELITVTIRTTDGQEGTGYSYTGGKGGYAIKAMIDYDLAPFLLGKKANAIEALYEAMGWHVHYVARGGIASFAISAIDIALWDIRCKSAGLPL